MKKLAYSALALVAFATPQLALAQDSKAEVTVGATAGYHDLGVSGEIEDLTPFEVEDGSAIFGGFVAVDFPINDNLFAGVEGNVSLGSDAIDAEYGASARFGYRTENGTKLYVRGGYQWIDLDLSELTGLDDDLIDPLSEDVVDDYLVGIGAEVPVGAFSLRANVDTVSFDTVRATAGVAFRF